MATIDDLEARLAELEARLGPTPLAVPPQTIGEYPDVPAPGSPIASSWAANATRRTVHRFNTVAARDAAYPAASAGPGAVCITVDTGTLWTPIGGAWFALAPPPTAWTAPGYINTWSDFGSGFQPGQYRKVGDSVEIRGIIKGGSVNFAAFTLPAGYRPPNALMFSTISFDAFGQIRINVAGDVIPTTPASNTSFAIGCRFSVL